MASKYAARSNMAPLDNSGDNRTLPQIHFFKDDNGEGDELDVYGGGFNFIDDAKSGWNDQVSSVVVVSGIWELWSDRDFGGRKLTLHPGVYHSIEAAGDGLVAGATAEPAGQGWNDQLSSFRVVRW